MRPPANPAGRDIAARSAGPSAARAAPRRRLTPSSQPMAARPSPRHVRFSRPSAGSRRRLARLVPLVIVAVLALVGLGVVPPAAGARPVVVGASLRTGGAAAGALSGGPIF